MRTSKTNLYYYRLCNLGTFLDLVAKLAEVDPSFIMETITRQITGLITVLPQLMADIKTFQDIAEGGGISNYYMVGMSAGRLFKVLFDYTISN